jgi:hypothetical protein
MESSHLIGGVAVEVHDVCAGEVLSVGEVVYWRSLVRMKTRVLKGESHLIGGVAVEVHDVSAGKVPIGRRRRVL